LKERFGMEDQIEGLVQEEPLFGNSFHTFIKNCLFLFFCLFKELAAWLGGNKVVFSNIQLYRILIQKKR
jgi:hypothetical protein